MTNGELIDILSKSPRDLKVSLGVRVNLRDVARINFEVEQICEYDDIIVIEQSKELAL